MKRHQVRARVHHKKRRAAPPKPTTPSHEAEDRGLDAYDRISVGYDLRELPSLEDAIDMYAPS